MPSVADGVAQPVSPAVAGRSMPFSERSVVEPFDPSVARDVGQLAR
ncbi:MAG TPA: hypothetical protein VGM94_00820 [Galbitalea sp.]